MKIRIFAPEEYLFSLLTIETRITNSGVAVWVPKILSSCSTLHHVIISICTEAGKKPCLTEILLYLHTDS